MANLLIDIRPYLETVYFCSAIIIATGLLFTRNQLLAFKTDINIRNTRAAAERAIEACKLYVDDYVNKDNERYRKQCDAKLASYAGVVGDFRFSTLSLTDQKNALDRAKAWGSVDHINNLELISAYFISGVADEMIGFKMIGKSLCSNVRYHYDVICMLRGHNTAYPTFQNIVDLYGLWSPRFTREELLASASELNKKIAGLPLDDRVKPIGVK